jgi:hypothetical protein
VSGPEQIAARLGELQAAVERAHRQRGNSSGSSPSLEVRAAMGMLQQRLPSMRFSAATAAPEDAAPPPLPPPASDAAATAPVLQDKALLLLERRQLELARQSVAAATARADSADARAAKLQALLDADAATLKEAMSQLSQLQVRA